MTKLLYYFSFRGKAFNGTREKFCLINEDHASKKNEPHTCFKKFHAGNFDIKDVARLERPIAIDIVNWSKKCSPASQ